MEILTWILVSISIVIVIKFALVTYVKFSRSKISNKKDIINFWTDWTELFVAYLGPFILAIGILMPHTHNNYNVAVIMMGLGLLCKN